MDKDLKKVVVLLAHPNMENSQANKALFDAIKDIEDVAVFNLYEMSEQDILNMDAWSRIISHANAVVYCVSVFLPFYWDVGTIFIKEMAGRGIFTYLAKLRQWPVKPFIWWLPLPVLNLGSNLEWRENMVSRWIKLFRPYQGSAAACRDGVANLFRGVWYQEHLMRKRRYCPGSGILIKNG